MFLIENKYRLSPTLRYCDVLGLIKCFTQQNKAICSTTNCDYVEVMLTINYSADTNITAR